MSEHIAGKVLTLQRETQLCVVEMICCLYIANQWSKGGEMELKAFSFFFFLPETTERQSVRSDPELFNYVLTRLQPYYLFP